MKKTELTNWIAALGVGSGVAFTTGVAAQAPTDVDPARTVVRGQVDAAALASVVSLIAPVYVVINHEEQYSIWPSEIRIPEGWRQLGPNQGLAEAAKRLEGRVGQLIFQVVINHEEQYSIWPANYEVPAGFEVKAKACKIVECAKQIEG